MLVDANILLHAVDEASPVHDRARSWLEEALNGVQRVALPWLSLAAFLRIVANPRALAEPLTPAEAWEHIDAWLAVPVAWSPEPGRSHGTILRRLTVEHDLRANLVSDAVLAALRRCTLGASGGTPACRPGPGRRRTRRGRGRSTPERWPPR